MLIPKPKQVTDIGGRVKIAQIGVSLCSVVNESGSSLSDEGTKIISKAVNALSGASLTDEGEYRIILRIDCNCPELEGIDSDEGYCIDIAEGEAILTGKSDKGTFYAACTFAQLLYADGDSVYVPQKRITDYPDFKYRGHFVECRYGTEFLTKENWFEFIDYMSEMKLNQLTVGVYGCWSVQYDDRPMEYLYIPISGHPELKTEKNIKYYSVKDKCWVHKDNLLPAMYEEDYLGEIIAYGKKKNVTVKPLFNSLGHNTLIPRLIPEISAKDKVGNSREHGFCTQSEKTYEVMFGIYDDIIEKYLKPNGIKDIEIGMDEVAEVYNCHCPLCDGRSAAELCTEYIIKLCKYLADKGMERIYIYHDMLFSEFDIVNEELKERFVKEGIYDKVVLDWWTYEDPKALFWGRENDVNGLFHSVIKPATGYYNWSIPTENNENIRACVKVAQRHGFEGVESYSSLEYCYDKNYRTVADVSWNASGVDDPEEFDRRYAELFYGDKASGAIDALRAMSDIMKDESRKSYINRACKKLEYYFYCYRNNYFTSETGLHLFPDEAYGLIRENESEYIPYLDYLRQKSLAAANFFENCGIKSRINMIWLLTAKHYYALSDEYLTLYGLENEYNSGGINAFEVIFEAERLLKQREELMYMAENVRMPATSYTYLRNMSVFRQILTDLIAYFKNAVSKSEIPCFDMKNFKNIASKTLEFLA